MASAMSAKSISGTLMDANRNAAPQCVLLLMKESGWTRGLTGSPLSREVQVRHEDVLPSFNPHRLLVSESHNQLQPLPNDLAHLGMNGGLMLFQIVRAMPQAPLGCRS